MRRFVCCGHMKCGAGGTYGMAPSPKPCARFRLVNFRISEIPSSHICLKPVSRFFFIWWQAASLLCSVSWHSSTITAKDQCPLTPWGGPLIDVFTNGLPGPPWPLVLGVHEAGIGRLIPQAWGGLPGGPGGMVATEHVRRVGMCLGHKHESAVVGMQALVLTGAQGRPSAESGREGGDEAGTSHGGVCGPRAAALAKGPMSGCLTTSAVLEGLEGRDAGGGGIMGSRHQISQRAPCPHGGPRSLSGGCDGLGNALAVGYRCKGGPLFRSREKIFNHLCYLPFSFQPLSCTWSLFPGWATFQCSLVAYVSKCLCSHFHPRPFGECVWCLI